MLLEMFVYGGVEKIYLDEYGSGGWGRGEAGKLGINLQEST